MSNPHNPLAAGTPPKRRLFLIFAGLILAFSALIAIKPSGRDYSAFDRTWGFDNISFYSLPFIILCLCLAVFIIVPAGNQLAQRPLQWLSARLVRLRKFKLLLFAGIAAVSVFVFYLCRIKYIFLGDLDLRMIQVMKKEFLTNEYLTMRALYSFAALGAKFGYAHQAMFKLYSFLCGGVFVFIACLQADLLGKTTLQKVLYLLLHLATGLLLVFCGYIEVYATPVVLLSLYVYLTLRYLRSGKQFPLVALSLALAIGSHLLCFAAVPSLIVAWYFVNRQKLKFIAGLSNKTIAISIILLVLVVLIMLLRKDSSFVLAVKAPRDIPTYMTFFSFRHFWELLNGQLLACGLSFIFVFLLLLRAIRQNILLNAGAYFLISLSGCLLFIVTIANLHRGSGDWDIMAITAVSLNLLTGLLITVVYANHTAVQNYLFVTLIFFNALNACLWVGINHGDKSIRKIERMLVTDPGTYYSARITGNIELIIVYKLNKLTDEMERAGLEACNQAIIGDLRPCVIYGKNLMAVNKMEKAKQVFEDLLARSPYIPESYIFLMDYYNKLKNEQKMMFYINGMFDAFMQQSQLFLTNANVQPVAYIQLFDILQQYELKNNNPARAAQIAPVIQQLRGMNLKAK